MRESKTATAYKAIQLFSAVASLQEAYCYEILNPVGISR